MAQPETTPVETQMETQVETPLQKSPLPDPASSGDSPSSDPKSSDPKSSKKASSDDPYTFGDYPVQVLFKRIITYIAPYKFRALVAMLITLPIGAMDGLIALSLRPYVDGLQGEGGFTEVSYIPFIIVGFTFIQGMLNYISIYLNGWVGFRVMSRMRLQLLQKLQHLDIQTVDQHTSGWVVNRFYKDPENFQINLLNNMKLILSRFFSMVFLCGVLITISWKLSIIAIVILLLTLYPSTRIRKMIKAISKDMAAAANALHSFYTETYGGIRVIKGFHMNDERSRQYQDLLDSVFQRYIKRVRIKSWLTPVMQVTSSLGVGLIIWQGSEAVVSGELTTGGFTSFIAALIMLYNPIKNLGSSIMNAQSSLIAANRMFKILDMDIFIHEQPNPVKLTRDAHRIEFRDVTFRYTRRGPAVLQHFNLTIAPKEKLALVGKSGGGKSTIVNLLTRFYDVHDEDGGIYINNIPIKDLSLASLRNNIALVLQDNFLFEGTVRENLQVGNPNATDAQLWDVLEQAYLAKEVSEMDGQLDAQVGERGVLFSGGQRQRLAIARAMLKNAPIVILDEATSALDSHAEAIVQHALDSLIADRTVIMIAHRLSTVQKAHRILVIEEGQIQEEGTHEELLQQNGKYQALYNQQFA